MHSILIEWYGILYAELSARNLLPTQSHSVNLFGMYYVTHEFFVLVIGV
jgi:hypothetical protein